MGLWRTSTRTWSDSFVGHSAGNLMKTREESPSSDSASMLSAAQISCHIAEGDADEDRRGWLHLNKKSSVLTIPRLLTSEEDKLGKMKTQVQFNRWIQLSGLWGRKKKPNIKSKLNLIPTEETPLTWLTFFQVDKKTIFICVFLSLLWFLCFTLDWLT